MKASLLEEPTLFFRDDCDAKDARTGLLAFGPYSGHDKTGERYIRIGAIGTAAGVGLLRQFLGQLRHPIHPPEGTVGETPFPGAHARGVLKFQFDLDPNAVLSIERGFVKGLEDLPMKQRVLSLTKHIVGELQRYRDEIHPAPDLALIALDDRLLEMCTPANQHKPRIFYENRTKGFKGARPPMFDFHNYIKAQAALMNLPTQILQPNTMQFASGTQPPHILAWNLAVGLYYKATGFPWKLADIDDETCFVGITHYRDWDEEEPYLRTSVAQVYMRTGESQVVRGEPFSWDTRRRGRDIYLESDHMDRLITDAAKIYRAARGGHKPKRIVVHKKGPFSDAELDGIQSALPSVDAIDAIHIQARTPLRAYVDKHTYPVTRGTMLDWGDQATLFTTGYVSSEDTYSGPGVPRPLQVIPSRLDSDLQQVCRDIMGLTKLDWNTAKFAGHQPVTLSVSHKVGEILAELPGDGPVPPGKYLYYM